MTVLRVSCNPIYIPCRHQVALAQGSPCEHCKLNVHGGQEYRSDAGVGGGRSRLGGTALSKRQLLLSTPADRPLLS